jgi:uncharacterized membrane protein YdjX (TVP38/TMEM64 family)
VDAVKRGHLVIAGVGALAVLALAIVLLRGTDLADVRATVASTGLWAPVVFVLLQVAVTITPIPRTMFSVAAGVLFGSVGGLLLTVAATTLAAVSAFFLVRLVGRRFVERHAHRRVMVWVRARLERSGLLAVLSLRLIPVVPFAALNYAAGLSGVRFPPFLVGTVFGVLPGTVAVVVLGDAAVGGNPPPALLVTSVVCGLLGGLGAMVVSRRSPLPPVVGEPPDDVAPPRAA